MMPPPSSLIDPGRTIRCDTVACSAPWPSAPMTAIMMMAAGAEDGRLELGARLCRRGRTRRPGPQRGGHQGGAPITGRILEFHRLWFQHRHFVGNEGSLGHVLGHSVLFTVEHMLSVLVVGAERPLDSSISQ